MNLIPWRNKDRTLDDVPVTAPRVAEEGFDRMVERMFEQAWNGWPLGLAATGAGDTAFPLALDVSESDDEVVVRAELPGLDAKDIELSVTGDVLTIMGEKSARTERRGEHVFHSERRFGAFRRSVRLPASVDAGRVSAAYEAGVLTVRLPRREEARPRRIEVRAGR